jgi:ubiquinone/menaquinone biosynthesis C-methylase UbiE
MITEKNTSPLPRSTGNDPAPATSQPAPSPALLFDTIAAYQKTAAIRAGIELDVFSALGEKPATADAIAAHCQAAPRGIRILCDYLTLLGFLTKSGDRYALTPDSAVFLNRKSPAYAGGVLEFMLSGDIRGMFDQLTASVRQGGTAAAHAGTMSPDHPIWLSFARAMASLMIPAATGLAELIKLDRNRSTKVLDISASHGAWGIAFAKKNPQTHLVALDWAPVLEITKKNAHAAGIASRFSTIAGSAFDVDLGPDYDVVLIPNFLHHFSPADCIRFLKRVHAALRPGGSVAVVEFVPNPDRVTPPAAAGFSLVMLATTAQGDAYTFAELEQMLKQAGFNPPTQHSLPASMNVAVIATKP